MNEITFLDQNGLCRAVLNSQNPITFLTGSAVSFEDGIGVPNVTGMLKVIRDYIEKRPNPLGAISEFDEKLVASHSPYQDAMRFVQEQFGQAHVNSIVREAVLKAKKSETEIEDTSDGVAADWHIPRATRALARLICYQRHKFAGPILTTNFDPLLPLALEEEGLPAASLVLQSDGDFQHQQVNNERVKTIVYLHGYWRSSDTLHTQIQLTQNRPYLHHSLQSLLRQKTLIVIGYGGWDDVFTNALVDLLDDQNAVIDVLWCFFENEESKIRERYAKLITKFAPAVPRARIRFYKGIDCNKVFDVLLNVEAPTERNYVRAENPSPLVGWKQILPNRRKEELKEASYVAFADGAACTWALASSGKVPILEQTHSVINYLQQIVEGSSLPSLTLLVSAAGEGKSTALMQVACVMAGRPEFRVLFNPKDGDFLPERICSLAQDFQWLLVLDDAHRYAPLLFDAIYAVQQRGHTHVHWICATRDSDWRMVKGGEFPWAQHCILRPFVFRGATEGDCEKLVTFFEGIGPRGLRKLSEESSTQSRALKLRTAITDNAINQKEGSLLGGLLDIRFDEQGLRDHMKTVLVRLNQRSELHQKNQLAISLLYIALCHNSVTRGMDPTVLGRLTGVPSEWVYSDIVRPLGEEVGIPEGVLEVEAPDGTIIPRSGMLYVRHSRVAQAVVAEAEDALGCDLREVWSRLIKCTIEEGKQTILGNYGRVVHAPSKLARQLPMSFDDAKRHRVAEAAARTAVSTSPNRLDHVTTLAATLRSAGRLQDAARVMQDALHHYKDFSDYEFSSRGAFYELGVIVGMVGNHKMNVVFSCFSVCDDERFGEMYFGRVVYGLLGIGVGCSKLMGRDSNDVYGKAVMAAGGLGLILGGPSDKKDHFKQFVRSATAEGVHRFASVDDAVIALEEAFKMIVASVGGYLARDWPRLPTNIGLSSLGNMVRECDDGRRMKFKGRS